jgi:alkaline phosphatase D
MDRGRRLRDGLALPDRQEEYATVQLTRTDLNDYRALYKNFLADPDLQDARARWPFVPVWDNHEFSWQGYQSVRGRIFNEVHAKRNALKVAASQAWYEYQPARVTKPGAGDPFEAPAVTDAPLTECDARGVCPRAQQSYRYSRAANSNARSGSARTST